MKKAGVNQATGKDNEGKQAGKQDNGSDAADYPWREEISDDVDSENRQGIEFVIDLHNGDFGVDG